MAYPVKKRRDVTAALYRVKIPLLHIAVDLFPISEIGLSVQWCCIQPLRTDKL